MAQFDVYANIHNETKKDTPYLLVVQHDLLKNLPAVVVIPLIYHSKPIPKINPIFEIENKKVIMATTEIVGVPKTMLSKKICSLEDKRSEILNAIDFLITGF